MDVFTSQVFLMMHKIQLYENVLLTLFWKLSSFDLDAIYF